MTEDAAIRASIEHWKEVRVTWTKRLLNYQPVIRIAFDLGISSGQCALCEFAALARDRTRRRNPLCDYCPLSKAGHRCENNAAGKSPWETVYDSAERWVEDPTPENMAASLAAVDRMVEVLEALLNEENRG